jgi:hypothetical protein
VRHPAERNAGSGHGRGTDEECLTHIGRVMKPDGFFDFTFGRTQGAGHQVLHEDFYYRTETLVALAGRSGLTGQLLQTLKNSRISDPGYALPAGPSYDTSRLPYETESDRKGMSWWRPTGTLEG